MWLCRYLHTLLVYFLITNFSFISNSCVRIVGDGLSVLLGKGGAVLVVYPVGLLAASKDRWKKEIENQTTRRFKFIFTCKMAICIAAFIYRKLREKQVKDWLNHRLTCNCYSRKIQCFTSPLFSASRCSQLVKTRDCRVAVYFIPPDRGQKVPGIWLDHIQSIWETYQDCLRRLFISE